MILFCVCSNCPHKVHFSYQCSKILLVESAWGWEIWLWVKWFWIIQIFVMHT